MVGYTSLMQKDEKEAKVLRDRHREVLERLITEHKGKVMQFYGDGTLSIFGSVIEATKCAVMIQNELQLEPKIPVRIGIHAGDIVYDDEGVYGDGVNIASRIQSLSVPGGVLISEKVNDELRNHSEMSTILIGEFRLKNVRKPIEIFAVKSDGLSLPNPHELESKAGFSSKSIAVLPFTNMSPDQDNEYFSDGITEEIINALTKIEGLKVTSRTSSFSFKGKNIDIREIGNKLNVSTVLEGSVRKFGNKVRITAQLINTTDGYHLWSEVYDRSLEDIFVIQDEISKQIAGRFITKPPEEIQQKIYVKSHTRNVDVYNLYLKGLYHFNKWSHSEFLKAITYFEEAIKAEPSFALPYSGLANCYTVLSAMGRIPVHSAYIKAKGLAIKSLELDDSLAESHIALAIVKLFHEWDWDGALNAFEKAMDLNFGSSVVHHPYAIYLAVQGEIEEAVKEMEIALSFDPLSPSMLSGLGEMYLFAGRYDDAIDQMNKVLELDPNFINAKVHLGYAYLSKGEYHKSLNILDELDFSNDEEAEATCVGFAYAIAGKKERVENYIKVLSSNENAKEGASHSLNLAYIYAALGDREKMYEYLEKSFDERIGGLIFIKIIPVFNKYRNDPEYKELLKKLKLK